MKTLKVLKKKVNTILYADVGTTCQHEYGRSDNLGFMVSAECAKIAALLEAYTKEEQTACLEHQLR
jgi:hypothetical protein